MKKESSIVEAVQTLLKSVDLAEKDNLYEVLKEIIGHTNESDFSDLQIIRFVVDILKGFE